MGALSKWVLQDIPEWMENEVGSGAFPKFPVPLADITKELHRRTRLFSEYMETPIGASLPPRQSALQVFSRYIKERRLVSQSRCWSAVAHQVVRDFWGGKHIDMAGTTGRHWNIRHSSWGYGPQLTVDLFMSKVDRISDTVHILRAFRKLLPNARLSSVPNKFDSSDIFYEFSEVGIVRPRKLRVCFHLHAAGVCRTVPDGIATYTKYRVVCDPPVTEAEIAAMQLKD